MISLKNSYGVVGLEVAHDVGFVSRPSHFICDLGGDVETDDVDSLEHLLGDPFDYMYDIMWEKNA